MGCLFYFETFQRRDSWGVLCRGTILKHLLPHSAAAVEAKRAYLCVVQLGRQRDVRAPARLKAQETTYRSMTDQGQTGTCRAFLCQGWI